MTCRVKCVNYLCPNYQLGSCTSVAPITVADVVSCQTMVLPICWQQRLNVNILETGIPTLTRLFWMKCSEIMGQYLLTSYQTKLTVLLICLPNCQKWMFGICRANFQFRKESHCEERLRPNWHCQRAEGKENREAVGTVYETKWKMNVTYSTFGYSMLGAYFMELTNYMVLDKLLFWGL